MSLAVTEKDAQDIRRLIPLNTLPNSRFEALCSELIIEEVPRGSILFNQGDAKNEWVYVLSGSVALQAGGMELDLIVGGTEGARFAIAHQIPRKVAAVAKDQVRFIRVNATYVSQPAEIVRFPLSYDPSAYEVSEFEESEEKDWMTALLRSRIFRRLSPANLQNLIYKLEEVNVQAGQVIVHQDEPGDYFYIIKKGRCSVTRKPALHAKEVKLAELKASDAFGEAALLSDELRGATITMMTHGVLLRLGKEDFLKLIKKPLIDYLGFEEGLTMVAQGSAAWVDVRSPDEFERWHLQGAVNLPSFILRMEYAELSRQRKCILVCDTGRLSEAAAFLLIRQGFEVYVLQGGIAALPANVINDEKTPPVLEISPGIGESSMQALVASEKEQPLPTNQALAQVPDDASRSGKGRLGGGEEAMLEKIGRLEAANAQLSRGKNQDAKKIEALEGKIAELNASLQERGERRPETEGGDEMKALRVELEKLRVQVATDASALQARLRVCDQDLARLRKRFRPMETVFLSVLMMAAGALLFFVLLRGTAIGREFLRSLASQF